ncbi:MAG: hypothetical protein GQ527_10450 [Bacteroidales bacterium]|nr:hypothetical protein [Bacteroidales bacterium]
MSFKSFLISKAFFKNLGVIFILGVVMVFATIKILDIYTGNGDFILIPKLEHKDADSLMFLSSKDYLQYEIADSVYANDRMPGTVVMQNPTAGAKVKNGRTVYLSIVAKTPEMVPMPNLVDLSIRRAVGMVKYAHLHISKIEFIDDIALNAVLDQHYLGVSIPPDTLIPSGSAIRLIVGNGYKKMGRAIPFLLGKNAQQARQLILKSSFNMGSIDTLKENFEGDWRVYRQNPHAEPNKPKEYPLGSEISITLRSANHFNFDSLVELHHLPDSLRYDALMFNENNIDF